MDMITMNEASLRERIASRSHAIRCLMANRDTAAVRDARFRTNLVSETLQVAQGQVSRLIVAERSKYGSVVVNAPKPERRKAEKLVAALDLELLQRRAEENSAIVGAAGDTLAAVRPHLDECIELAIEALQIVEAALGPIIEAASFLGRNVKLPDQFRKSAPFADAQIRVVRLALGRKAK